jgi:hypothetical protein
MPVLQIISPFIFLNHDIHIILLNINLTFSIVLNIADSAFYNSITGFIVQKQNNYFRIQEKIL